VSLIECIAKYNSVIVIKNYLWKRVMISPAMFELVWDIQIDSGFQMI
jgi:hypothetical protein